MAALGRGLAHGSGVEGRPPPAFSDWRGWVGRGRWRLWGLPLCCLDVSRLPGESKEEPCLAKRSALGERKMAKEVLGHLLVHCQTVITSSPAGYIPGGVGSGSHCCLQSLSVLLICSASFTPEHFQHFSLSLMFSLHLWEIGVTNTRPINTPVEQAEASGRLDLH